MAAAVADEAAAASVDWPAAVRVRLAVPEDAAKLSHLKVDTFKATFLEDFAIPYPADDLAAFEAASYGLPAIERELANPDLTVFVAEQGDRLVGYAKVGPCKLPHPEVGAGEGELCQLYVRREAQGMGLGKQLMDLAMAKIRSTWSGAIWLGVWSGNHRAQAFYAAYGFKKVGEYEFPVGSWKDHEFIFRRDAAAVDPAAPAAQ